MSFDLHSHSTASDGGLSPAELVRAAAEAGVAVLALTDHDTTAGLAEAHLAAEKENLRVINGIEISVSWQKRTLHIVGLGIDPGCPVLSQGLQRQQAVRQRRAEGIAARLEKQGLSDALGKAQILANGAQLTRTHFARLLVESGLCKDMPQAFKRYLAAGKPAYVSTEWASLEDAIHWIHSAGGVAALAHPMLYKQTAAWRQRMLIAFKAAGGDALEVCCGNSNPEQVQLSTKDALQHDLLASVGSDFHHVEQRWIKLGRTPAMPSTLTPVWTDPRLLPMLQ